MVTRMPAVVITVFARVMDSTDIFSGDVALEGFGIVRTNRLELLDRS